MYLNENTFVGNFFFQFDVFLSLLLFFLHFCLLRNFVIINCIVKSLIATFIDIQLQKENLKPVFWAPKTVYRSPKRHCWNSSLKNH